MLELGALALLILVGVGLFVGLLVTWVALKLLLKVALLPFAVLGAVLKGIAVLLLLPFFLLLALPLLVIVFLVGIPLALVCAAAWGGCALVGAC